MTGQKAVVRRCDLPNLPDSVQEHISRGCDHCSDTSLPIVLIPAGTSLGAADVVLCEHHAREVGRAAARDSRAIGGAALSKVTRRS